ncbi:hypothetical protein BC628DRAFT_822439 [Trametes gibbosa]|nr:hypothetical protein BC628DRAFT_822439 [Trametes gibbosa]
MAHLATCLSLTRLFLLPARPSPTTPSPATAHPRPPPAARRSRPEPLAIDPPARLILHAHPSIDGFLSLFCTPRPRRHPPGPPRCGPDGPLDLPRTVHHARAAFPPLSSRTPSLPALVHMNSISSTHPSHCPPHLPSPDPPAPCTAHCRHSQISASCVLPPVRPCPALPRIPACAGRSMS